jgi:hypothetical protein
MKDLTFSINKNVVSIFADGKKIDNVTFPPECTEEEIKNLIKKYIGSLGAKPLEKGKKHR